MTCAFNLPLAFEHVIDLLLNGVLMARHTSHRLVHRDDDLDKVAVTVAQAARSHDNDDGENFMLRREMLAAMAGLELASMTPPTLRAAEETKIPTIPGPDPNTRTPTFKAPPDTVDTHTHIFGPAAVYPFSPTRPYSPPDAPPEAIRARHKQIG